MHDFSSATWNEALQDFLLHVEATRAAKTYRYHKVQLSGLADWCDKNNMPFASFGKRHLSRYIAYRIQTGKSRMTLRHDGMCAKVFYAWCAKNDLIAPVISARLPC